jgi:hypothetical protein
MTLALKKKSEAEYRPGTEKSSFKLSSMFWRFFQLPKSIPLEGQGF